MNAEIIVASLLNKPAIVALVGTRRALGQLPQNTAMPALVYNIIDGLPEPNVAFQQGAQRAFARIQINPLALTIPEVKSIHAAVRAAIDFTLQQTVAGKKVISCRFDNINQITRDIESGIWTQSADYLLRYYE
jgi:hypothetical protein